jgi:hypothetical protein
MLCRCREHLGRHADFPALRGPQGSRPVGCHRAADGLELAKGSCGCHQHERPASMRAGSRAKPHAPRFVVGPPATSDGLTCGR